MTIYNTAGAYPADTIDIATLGKVVLTAPASGTYQGIGIFRDRSLNQAISITGSGLNAIAGTVYAPAAAVNLTGAAAVGLDTLGGAFISRTIQVAGIGSVNVDLGSNPPRIPDSPRPWRCVTPVTVIKARADLPFSPRRMRPAATRFFRGFPGLYRGKLFFAGIR